MDMIVLSVLNNVIINREIRNRVRRSIRDKSRCVFSTSNDWQRQQNIREFQTKKKSYSDYARYEFAVIAAS